MAFVIKKKISLEFLGDEYKGSELNFNAVTVKEYKTLMAQINSVKDDNEKSMDLIVKILKDKLIDGKIIYDGETSNVEKDDVDSLDAHTITFTFRKLMGEADPKD